MRNVVDLFSGAGGMSYGFHAHPAFRLVGAADAELGKPSSPAGSLQCNSTYRLNIGIDPVVVDLSTIDPAALRHVLGLTPEQKIDVLCACPLFSCDYSAMFLWKRRSRRGVRMASCWFGCRKSRFCLCVFPRE